MIQVSGRLFVSAALVACMTVCASYAALRRDRVSTSNMLSAEAMLQAARSAPAYQKPGKPTQNTGFNSLNVHQIVQVQRFPAVRTRLELGGKPQAAQLADGTIVVAGFADPRNVNTKQTCVTIQWSTDNGATFSKPKIFPDMQGRTSGLRALRDGTLILAHGASFVSRSTDAGHSWTQVELPDDVIPGEGPLVLGEVSGCVELPDGTLLMHVARRIPNEYKWMAYVVRSRDGGRTWGDPTRVPTHTDADEISYELLSSGRILGIARCSAAFIKRNGLEDVVPGGRDAPLGGEPGESPAVFWSDDYGRTWSDPKPTGLGVLQAATYPLELSDGRVVLLIGHRQFPFGVQAVASRDGGETFDVEHPLMLAWFSWSYYCGHPRSVRLQDGSVLTGYYTHYIMGDPPRHNEKCTGELVRWRPPDDWPPSRVKSERRKPVRSSAIDEAGHKSQVVGVASRSEAETRRGGS